MYIIYICDHEYGELTFHLSGGPRNSTLGTISPKPAYSDHDLQHQEEAAPHCRTESAPGAPLLCVSGSAQASSSSSEFGIEPKLRHDCTHVLIVQLLS